MDDGTEGDERPPQVGGDDLVSLQRQGHGVIAGPRPAIVCRSALPPSVESDSRVVVPVVSSW